MSTLLEVFLQFFALGCTSFGGPVAHLGYFYERFVQRERWLTADAYTDLVALCQLLPGPSSSQVGMGIGLIRAGWLGGLAAWVGFTLPSAVLMVLAAALLSSQARWFGDGWIHGLLVAAVAVVAQAVLSLQKKLAPDRERATLMALSAVLVLIVPHAWAQLLALLIGGLAGLVVLAPQEHASLQSERLAVPLRRSLASALLGFLLVLLLALPWLSAADRPLVVQQLSGFLRTGALVFGGGHVVLPLLEQSLVPKGWIGMDQFLAGYGFAQALPGPMFSFAAFLGFDLKAGLHGLGGALMAITALFLPSFLLIGGILPFWSDLGRLRMMRRALVGINAAVVGILLAALFQPVWQSAIHGGAEFSLAMTAFLMLICWKQPAWRVVLFCALVGGLFLS
ncbi:MAG: chromate efflux transporter [Synechococcus sp.]|nr:chromate efflux transporter [Synechococcus sp.]